MSEKKYIVSIDGGGTKTAICIMETVSQVKKHYEFGSSNYQVVGIEVSKTNLIDGYKQAISLSGINKEDIIGSVFGLSGLDTNEDLIVYRELISELQLPNEICHICNDAETAFYSKGQSPGLVVIAGTGSIGFGLSESNEDLRIGGYGSPISDLGSGYWIGIEVLKDLIRYCEGYFEYQPVFDDILKHCQISDFIHLPQIVMSYKGNQISALARHVCEGATGEDVYCRDIINKAAGHTSDIGKIIYQKLAFENEDSIDVVLAGSLFKNEYYRSQFIKNFSEKTINSNANFLAAVNDTTEGGLRIGQEKWCK